MQSTQSFLSLAYFASLREIFFIFIFDQK